MKKYIIISLLLVSFFGANKAFSSALSKFQIQSTYLVSGKLNVPNSSVITTFKVDFDITRQYINVNNQNQPEKVDWTVTVMYSASSSPGAGDNIAISDPFRIIESDFPSNNPLVYSKTGLEAKLPANKTNGLIFLKYSYYLWSQGVKSTNPVVSNSTTTYGISATATNPTNPNPPTDITKIQNMGFSTIGMQTFSTYYVVEGDIRITKALLGVTTNPYYGVNNTYDHNINIKVDASVWSSSNWYNGILEAARVWNTANTDIKINLIYDSFTYSIAPRVDVVVKGGSLQVSPTKIPFEAEWVKGNGSPGGEIIVNTAPGYVPASGDDILNLFHAIAHTMALGHTSSNIPDHQNSLLSRSFQSISAWSYLVGSYSLPFANDVTYFNSRYPVNSSSVIISYINGPATFSSSASVTFRSSYISSEAGITYTWKAVGINGTTYNYQESGSNPVLYDFGLPSGNYRLECTISGGKYVNAVTATKNIIVN